MREPPEGFHVTPIAEVAANKVGIWEGKESGTRVICIEEEWDGCFCRHVFSPNDAFLLAQALLEAVTQIGQTCANERCKKRFVPGRANRQYCSHECQHAQKQREYRLRKKQARIP